jgi:anti-anti-sigma regulatory factor
MVSLTAECVNLLEAEYVSLLSDSTPQICIDLKELTFLDETAAGMLAHLKKRFGVRLEGSELFTRQMVNGAAEDP